MKDPAMPRDPSIIAKWHKPIASSRPIALGTASAVFPCSHEQLAGRGPLRVYQTGNRLPDNALKRHTTPGRGFGSTHGAAGRSDFHRVHYRNLASRVHVGFNRREQDFEYGATGTASLARTDRHGFPFRRGIIGYRNIPNCRIIVLQNSYHLPEELHLMGIRPAGENIEELHVLF
jgi:hypothetical protein